MSKFWQFLGMAVAGAGTLVVATTTTDPHVLTDWKKLGTVAAAGAIVGIGGLAKQSPLTPKDPTPPDVK